MNNTNTPTFYVVTHEPDGSYNIAPVGSWRAENRGFSAPMSEQAARAQADARNTPPKASATDVDGTTMGW